MERASQPSVDETMAAAPAPAPLDDTISPEQAQLGLDETRAPTETEREHARQLSAQERSLAETAAPEAQLSVEDTMMSGSDAGSPRPRTSAPKGGESPRMINRYVVLGRLGAGAMGEVLAAYDPRLDRKVALKRVHANSARLDAALRRLEREAQALARLDHRNVVKVHDVIVHEDSVYVAMEFVEGQTLDDWMQGGEDERPRPWREIVPVFAAFGAGLAAVHAVGLVHRDVKPGNVMIGEDERVRVMDFGLARLDEDEAPDTSLVAQLPEEVSEFVEGLGDSLFSSQSKGHSQVLTQVGAVLGTPAYMAPEQFLGMRATARSDLR